MEFSNEEMEELRRCINTMISSRIEYKYIENSEARIELNNKYLKMDYLLLDKVLKELKKNEVNECQ
jgi:hypothetical protein